MASSIHELPTDRLATADGATGKRIWLYPADVRGFFRRWRNHTQAVLIAIFLILPWIKIGGHQALLLDLANRRFAIFGLTFWAHDAPRLVFVLGTLAFSILLITAARGRLWCGWGCPQTVFIDGVYRRIERWTEGDAVVRRRRDQGPLTGEKLLRKSAKWALYLVCSLIIAHSFLAYFVGTERLLKMMQHSPSESPESFLIMAIAAGVTLFDFGWFREQFCVIMCPYGRLQSVLMDEHTVTVAYDVKRGEPRKGSDEAQIQGRTGDCVNCYRCVQVCPTGIDIRRGTQLECIGCTACIDACDEVMTKLKRDTGLIRYSSEAALKGQKTLLVRGRTLLYGFLLAVMAIGLVIAAVTHHDLDLTVIRAVESPFQLVTAQDGTPSVINHFKIDYRNQSFEDYTVTLVLDSDLLAKGAKLVTALPQIQVKAGTTQRADYFIEFPKSLLKLGSLRSTLKAQTLPELKHPVDPVEVRLVGPIL